jgi:hypothetical protein
VQQTAERVDSATTSPQVRTIVTDVSAASTELRRAATQVRDLSARFASSQEKTGRAADDRRLTAHEDQLRARYSRIDVK